MIAKVIQHNNMPRSVNYLYQKAEQNKDTPVHPVYNTAYNKDEFMHHTHLLMSKYEAKNQKKITLNNQIKHLMIAFHPSEKDLFEDIKDVILKEFFSEIGLDASNFNANVFKHNDQSHPHLHIIFNRLGNNGDVFNDKKIGERIGEIAKKLSIKHGLKHGKDESKISFTSKELYKPTTRSKLLKLINYSMNEANSLTEFQTILKEHGVSSKKTKDNKIVYMTPNPNPISKDDIPELINFAMKESKNDFDYRKILNANGLYVKKGEDGKDIFSIQKVNTWTEDVMPRATRMNQLYKNIKKNNHDESYLNLRNQLKEALNSCGNLAEIKNMLPGSELKFTKKDNKIFNVKIEYEGYIIRLEEFFDYDIEFDSKYEKSDYMKIPLIFTPRSFSDFEEKQSEMLAKKHGKKHRQIGFKVQI